MQDTQIRVYQCVESQGGTRVDPPRIPMVCVYTEKRRRYTQNNNEWSRYVARTIY